MDKITIKYNKLFIKLKKLRENDDNEASHILQDKIYRKFVKDICNNNLSTLTDIKKIADDMNKHIVKHDKGRWYA